MERGYEPKETGFESDQIQGTQKASITGTVSSIIMGPSRPTGRHQLNQIGGVVVPVAGFEKG